MKTRSDAVPSTQISVTFSKALDLASRYLTEMTACWKMDHGDGPFKVNNAHLAKPTVWTTIIN